MVKDMLILNHEAQILFHFAVQQPLSRYKLRLPKIANALNDLTINDPEHYPVKKIYPLHILSTYPEPQTYEQPF